jgi:nucleoside-diphosphate-sugar epimerase
MNASGSTKTCAVTGANGYVGARLKAHLQRSGIQVVGWTRRAPAGSDTVSFQLGQKVQAKNFSDTTALVHCAYDFKARKWNEIVATNVRGSERLLHAAKAGGVGRIIFISSMAAFNGCRSMYGRAKLEIEQIALSLGAIVIRPGLVYGNSPGGIFGGLVRQVKGHRFVLLPGGGEQLRFLVHDQDLGRFVERCVRGNISPPGQPITLAHEEGWSMRRLLACIGDALGRQVTFLPVPWRLAWLGLKTFEWVGLPTPFRSDSLISLIRLNPAPSFELAKSLNTQCRPFKVVRSMLE